MSNVGYSVIFSLKTFFPTVLNRFEDFIDDVGLCFNVISQLIRRSKFLYFISIIEFLIRSFGRRVHNSLYLFQFIHVCRSLHISLIKLDRGEQLNVVFCFQIMKNHC